MILIPVTTNWAGQSPQVVAVNLAKICYVRQRTDRPEDGAIIEFENKHLVVKETVDQVEEAVRIAVVSWSR